MCIRDSKISFVYEQYGALAHSLLNGRLDLRQDPPEELLALDNPYDSTAREAAQVNSLWDHAYYNGRYYVYFGIVPCLLFQLPFEAVTGIQNLAYPPCMIAVSYTHLDVYKRQVSGGYLNFWWYSPSTERKSGMPLSVETPAPPKNTRLRVSRKISSNAGTIQSSPFAFC